MITELINDPEIRKVAAEFEDKLDEGYRDDDQFLKLAMMQTLIMVETLYELRRSNGRVAEGDSTTSEEQVKRPVSDILPEGSAVEETTETLPEL